MCNVAAVGAGLSGGSDIAGTILNYEANRKDARQQRQLIGQQTTLTYRDLARRRMEERAATADTIANAQRQARLALGAARAQAGEGGVAGNSVGALVGDVLAQEGRVIDNVRRTQQFRERQINSQIEATELSAQAQLFGATQPVFPWLKLIGLGGGTAAGITSALK